MCHLGQAVAVGCPVTLNCKGLVQAWELLSGFAGEAQAMASVAFADWAAIALNSRVISP